MAYLVQADVLGQNEARTIKVFGCKAALTLGSEWLDQGRTGIRIIGDGRVYHLDQFAKSLEEGSIGD